MFIDIHVHAQRIPGPPNRQGKAPLATPEQLLERYDELGIEKAILLPLVSPECSVATGSVQEIVDIARQWPDRFVPFCSVDPRSCGNHDKAPLGEALEYWKSLGCKGVGEVVANMPILGGMVQNLLDCTEKAGLPLTFHIAAQEGGMYGLIDDPGLPGLERSIALHPGLKFFAHSQTFWAEMAPLETVADRYGYPRYPIKEEGAVPKMFRRYPNLYGDLSAGSGHNALARDPEYAVRFLEEFQDRLLFGTDICAPDTPTPLVDFLTGLRDEGKISAEVFEKVARGNAKRLLGI